MPITTKHKYILKYPIKESDESLILGTIHPTISVFLNWNFFMEIKILYGIF